MGHHGRHLVPHGPVQRHGKVAQVVAEDVASLLPVPDQPPGREAGAVHIPSRGCSCGDVLHPSQHAQTTGPVVQCQLRTLGHGLDVRGLVGGGDAGQLLLEPLQPDGLGRCLDGADDVELLHRPGQRRTGHVGRQLAPVLQVEDGLVGRDAPEVPLGLNGLGRGSGRQFPDLVGGGEHEEGTVILPEEEAGAGAGGVVAGVEVKVRGVEALEGGRVH